MFYPIVPMIYTTWQCHANKNDERVGHFSQPRQHHWCGWWWWRWTVLLFLFSKESRFFQLNRQKLSAIVRSILRLESFSLHSNTQLNGLRGQKEMTQATKIKTTTKSSMSTRSVSVSVIRSFERGCHSTLNEKSLLSIKEHLVNDVGAANSFNQSKTR